MLACLSCTFTLFALLDRHASLVDGFDTWVAPSPLVCSDATLQRWTTGNRGDHCFSAAPASSRRMATRRAAHGVVRPTSKLRRKTPVYSKCVHELNRVGDNGGIRSHVITSA